MKVTRGEMKVTRTFKSLDGFISVDDYTAIDFAVATPGAYGWSNGDFNYDGFISADDYTVIDFNLVAQNAGAGESASLQAAGGAANTASALVRPQRVLLSAVEAQVAGEDDDTDEVAALA